MTDPTRRDALIRALSPWLATLDESDVELVDALVFYLVANRDKPRDEQIVGPLRVHRDRIFSPPTRGIEAGLRELRAVSPPYGVAMEFDLGGEA